MDRRKFLKASVLEAAGLAVAPAMLAQEVRAGVIVPGEVYTDGKRANVSADVDKHLKVSGYVKEPSHRIPVVAEADVVVAGGGAAGVAAAVCAARQGASVILVEKANFLGGLWTGGLVLPVLATHGKGKVAAWDKATGGFCSEMCDTLLANGWATNPLNPLAEPEAAKYLLEKTLADAGVRILYNSTVAGVVMSGNRIDCVLVDCNTGRIALRCKVAVDATGDGLLFSFAGDPYEARRYHMSTSYRLAGVSSDASFCMRTPVPQMRYSTYGTREAVDGLDIFAVSQTQREHRLAVWEKIEQKKKEPGFEDIFLMELAPVTGVRVTRVLESLHNVTLEESMEWTEFDDVVGMSGMCDPFTYKGRRIEKKDRPIWQIPYRSLLPRETRNLLVAGRCFGYDQGITWDAREISTCMVTGQAAGTAAAMAAASGCAASEIDVSYLQGRLRAASVRLEF
ncbi:MAG: FAD-dependent oxidoreductase [Bacteroidales bacterium]|nr:FAD-dependent oxidoreductase [Bacteroidales bacterium]